MTRWRFTPRGEHIEAYFTTTGATSRVVYFRVVSERTPEIEVASMNDLLNRITIDPLIAHGKPVIRGLRYPVETIQSRRCLSCSAPA